MRLAWRPTLSHPSEVSYHPSSVSPSKKQGLSSTAGKQYPEICVATMREFYSSLAPQSKIGFINFFDILIRAHSKSREAREKARSQPSSFQSLSQPSDTTAHVWADTIPIKPG